MAASPSSAPEAVVPLSAQMWRRRRRARPGHRQGYFSRPEADIASQVFVGRDGWQADGLLSGARKGTETFSL
jgi:hypothetical protein